MLKLPFTRRDSRHGASTSPDSEYDVVFTANASGALRLVGEAFAFERGSRLVLSADNHNSVNGLRELARARGAEIHYARLDGELRLEGVERLLTRATAPSLLAFPAQSNFSGVQHPLALIDTARRAGYAVLLDAAAFVPTNPLALGHVRPDFVALSFYKMFGYPTGLGALIARHDALGALRRDLRSRRHPCTRRHGRLQCPRPVWTRHSVSACGEDGADARRLDTRGLFLQPRYGGASIRVSCRRNSGVHEPRSPRRISVEKFAGCLGGEVAVGAVRASLGIASNESDLGRLLDVIQASL